MGLSFGFTTVKGLRKKMKRSKGRRNIGALFKPDSKPSTVEEIPEDVLMEILARLPANSLMMFKCVSKRWLSLISSRYLTNLFLETPSPSRQRRQFMYLVDKGGRGDYALLSTSPENSNSEGNICILNQDLTMPGMGGCFVNALRGLMCFRIGRRVQICNLTTKQSVKLPLVRSSILEDDSNMWNYFGYDAIQDEYKMLSTVWKVSNEERVVRSEHQVLVLGPGASWRSTRSTNPPPPHRPYSQGISINGVLYYGAWNDKNTCVF